MTWILFALLLSFTAAFFAEANRYFKMDGYRLIFWQGLVSTVILTPVIFTVPWPGPSLFYVAAIFMGTTAAVSAALRFNLSAQKKGRVTTLFLPIESIGAFGLWLLIDESQRAYLAANPITLVAILLAFGLISGALNQIRQNDACWQTFIIVAPLGLMHAFTGVFSKMALPPALDVEIVLLYVFIVRLAMTFSAGSMLLGKRQHNWAPPGMLRVGLLYGVLSTIAGASFNAAIQTAPNPGYVAAIIMLAPVWIMLLHRARGIPDDASPRAALVMVAGAVLLAVVAS